MLAARALQRLTAELTSAIAAMGLSGGGFGKPDLVEKPVREAEAIFQGFAKARPSAADAYATARAFLDGDDLDSWQRNLIASAVATPIREHGGALALSSPRFTVLLRGYEDEVRQGDLWRLTWHGLLYSYFSFDVSRATHPNDRSGWDALRQFLERTWPLIDGQAHSEPVPDWVRVLRSEPDVLTRKPVSKYAQAYLGGDTSVVDRLSQDLGMPPSSWFWHALVLAAVRHAASETDQAFQRQIPNLLHLIQGKPGFRDEALEAILVRYHQRQSAPPHGELRDYACQSTVWKNPKLKAAGIATAWNRVPDPVWRMVLGWVNERNLKDFFDILAARNKADEGRLAFWSRYLRQITWTRLIFGADTMALKRTNPGIRDLIAREEGAYAQLTGKREVDAFIMRIGAHIIVEYSKKPNACYVYEANKVPFDQHSAYYVGGKEDLGAGPNQVCACRIVHTPGWEPRADDKLRGLGIFPDPFEPPSLRPAAPSPSRPTTSAPTIEAVSRNPSWNAPAGGQTSAVPRPVQTAASTPGSTSAPNTRPGRDISGILAIVERFYGARVDDQRGTYGGGRLWVVDPLNREPLANELKALGFRWSGTQNAWYLPER